MIGSTTATPAVRYDGFIDRQPNAETAQPRTTQLLRGARPNPNPQRPLQGKSIEAQRWHQEKKAEAIRLNKLAHQEHLSLFRLLIRHPSRYFRSSNLLGEYWRMHGLKPVYPGRPVIKPTVAIRLEVAAPDAKCPTMNTTAAEVHRQTVERVWDHMKNGTIQALILYPRDGSKKGMSRRTLRGVSSELLEATCVDWTACLLKYEEQRDDPLSPLYQNLIDHGVIKPGSATFHAAQASRTK